MKKTFYSLLAFGFLFMSTSTLSAQTCTTDQSYLGSNTLQTAIGSNTTVPDGQSFRAGLSGALNAVSLDISASNPGCSLSTMNVKIDILNGDGINGAVLASETFNIPTTLTRTLYNFNFSSPAVVSATQLYTIIFTLLPGQNCGSGEPQLIWYFNFPTNFWTNTGGRQYQDGVVTSLGNTQYFKTCVGPVAVAEALNIDGVNDRVNLGTGLTTSLSGGTKVSVEVWVKPTSLSGLGNIIGNYNTGSNNLQILLRRGNNLYYEFWVGNGTNWYSTFSVATPTLNTWQHVAGTWDGTVAKIYVNGVLSGTTTPALTTLGSAGSNPVWIGGNTINESFTGNIDEVRVWNVARTQCEINTYKNCEIPTTSTGLLANYHFNQGIDAGTNTSVTTLTDASASAFTGTLTNMTLTGTTSNWVAPGGVTSGSVTPANLAITVGSTVSNSVICSGNSTTLSGTGANTYVWTGGVTNAVAFAPTVTNTYTVTGTNTLTGCTNTAVSSVTVNSLPTVSVNSGPICAGQSFTMVPAGASTYIYSNGTDVVTPLANDSYTVTGTDANGCENTAVSSVTVNALPVIVSESGSVTVCGDATGTFSINATNAAQYEWGYSNGGSTTMIDGSYGETGYTTTVMQIPTLQSEGWNGYDITCLLTSAEGCTVVSSPKTITVNQLPSVSVNSGAICAGQSFTIVPTGATTYTYSNGTDIVTPSANDSYTVTGTDANGCENTAVSTVTVNALPVLTAVTNNTLLCAGQTATLTVSGATTYTWSTTANTTTVAVSPTVQTTYTVNGTDANGCSNNTTVTQNVSSCTGIATLSNDASINVYPNPNNGLFVIELTSASKLTVMNALGQVVIAETFEAGKHTVNINNESIGVYFVKVMTNNKQQIIKVIKQ